MSASMGVPESRSDVVENLPITASSASRPNAEQKLIFTDRELREW